MDIIDDRHANRSTIISSQIPVSAWYEVIGGEGTIADAILDRIVNSSHRIDLNYYYYYHCTSACGVRFKAETANEAFLKQLRYMSPKEAMVDVFIEAFIKDFNNKTKAQNTERANIIGEIDVLNKRYQNALLKNADGEMADDDFQEVKKLTKGKIEVLERRLNDGSCTKVVERIKNN